MALRPDRHHWGRDVIRDEITTRLVKFRPVSFWYGRNDISVAVSTVPKQHNGPNIVTETHEPNPAPLNSTQKTDQKVQKLLDLKGPADEIGDFASDSWHPKPIDEDR
jgi:hypothetical protein